MGSNPTRRNHFPKTPANPPADPATRTKLLAANELDMIPTPAEIEHYVRGLVQAGRIVRLDTSDGPAFLISGPMEINLIRYRSISEPRKAKPMAKPTKSKPQKPAGKRAGKGKC